MPRGYDLAHIRIDAFGAPQRYRRPKVSIKPRDYGREAAQHSEDLKRQLASSFEAATAGLLAHRGEVVGGAGTYVGIETAPGASVPNLEWSREGIRVGSLERTDTGSVRGTLFVPDTARDFFTNKIEEYGSKRTAKDRPSHSTRFEPLDRFFEARLLDIWTDSRNIPDQGDETWWECWCWPDRVHNAISKAESLNLTVSSERLTFPERVLIYVYGKRSDIAQLVASTDAIAELRMGRDSAAFFLGQRRPDQQQWVQSSLGLMSLGSRADQTALCILDTGVNNGHDLLQPVLSDDRRYAVRSAWGVDDHHGHGSEMAGLATLGDLTTFFQTMAPVAIDYKLESVKLIPPDTAVQTEPRNFGLITTQAVSLPEIDFPTARRVYCMAVTQPNVHGPRATSWSAALDNILFECARPVSTPPLRLMFVSAGNLQDDTTLEDLETWSDHEIEDPAQAWNTLTIGGTTEKCDVLDPGYEHWKTAADVGGLSPYSRVSAAWNRGVAPIKPELVLEGGNRGIDPVGNALSSGMPSLSLLTTSSSPVVDPLSISWATSAATALGARMGAALWAANADLWPETIRALLVHSARWTPWMENKLFQSAQKSPRLLWLRKFGYGVPSLDRALRSATNSLALVAERELQPFGRDPAKSYAVAKEADFFALPWPKAALLELGAQQVRLRVTLSYFVEPNPNAEASILASRYRSAGLRFGLQLPNETAAQFAARINELATVDEEDIFDLPDTDDARVLGEKSISAGSIHVDEWRGAAAGFADRNCLAVFPVGGWWKGVRKRCEDKMRYSLVVTIDAGDTDVDLYSEVAIAAGVSVSS